jgi:hypothetical protein
MSFNCVYVTGGLLNMPHFEMISFISESQTQGISNFFNFYILIPKEENMMG